MGDDEAKHNAAQAALELVQSGMMLGLGSGSTAEIFLNLLAQRIKAGLKVSGVPTSRRTEALARRLGIPLVSPSAAFQVDLAVDGADEVAPDLCLIKGLGGALLREKIVASAAKKVVIIVDESKIVPTLGARCPVPVEVVPFAWPLTSERLRQFGCDPCLRRSGSIPVVTDNGNYILDCRFGPIRTPAALEKELNAVPGVVENGIFCGIAGLALVGNRSGVQEMAPGPPKGK